MPDWVAVIILGIIEGVTEFLPISSTGHLLIAEHWLPRQSEMFNVVIQCGAVLAVVAVFSARCQQLLLGWHEPATRDYLAKLVLAFGLTGAGALVLKKLGFVLPKTIAPIGWASMIGGLCILAIEAWARLRPVTATITWPIAVAVAGAQILAAAWPGTSRSGASILLPMALGLSRPAATEFSFLVGIPTMLAAGAWEIHHTLKHSDGEAAAWDMVLLGTVAAAVTAFATVKWLLRFVQSHTFNGFGWYRVGLGVLLLVWPLAR